MTKGILTILILGCLLAACAPASPSPETTLAEELTIETYALREAPMAEWTELPLADTAAEDPLLKYEDERSQPFPASSCVQADQYGLCAQLGSDQLVAAEDYSDPAAGQVVVTRNGEEIYRIPIGEASPIPGLRGLWVYDGHWALETVRVTNEQDGNEIQSLAIGQITVDGSLLNDQPGYEETFGFQTIHGRPFYFFKKDGKINASYDGEVVTLGYDEIPHYGCCSAATLNPMAVQNMVAFFARKGSEWSYVVIGVFGQP